MISELEMRIVEVVARTRAADAYLRLGDVGAASALIAELLSKDPQNLDALLLRAKVAMVRRDFDAAVNDFRAVLQGRPRSLETLGMLVRAYVVSGQADLAEK